MKSLKKGLLNREYFLIVFLLILTSVFCQDSKKVQNYNSTQNEEKGGCTLEDGIIIEFGGSKNLPGCKVLRCVRTDNSFALIHVSCETSQNDIPPGCKIVPRPELQFPNCCEIVMHCEKSMTHVFPVVFTRQNISQVEHNDSINRLRIGAPHMNEIFSDDVIKRSNIKDSTRYKRELNSSMEINNSNVKETKKTKGCVTEHGFINEGKELILPGCFKLKCIETEEGLALVNASCPSDHEKLPKGCKVVPPITKKSFPECCKAKLVCVKKVIELSPAVYTKNHSSFNTSDAKVARKLKKSPIPPKEIIKTSQKRLNRDLRTQILPNETVEESVNKCVNENGSLFLGEVIPLPGCQEKKCLLRNGSYNIVHLGCDVTAVEIPEGCKMLNSTPKQFPKCCEIILVCEEIITELFETVYTPYNISKVNLNNSESSVDNHKSKEDLNKSSVNLKTTKEENNNETSRANSDRQIESRTNLNNSKEDIIGCLTDTGTIRLGERVPMPNCSQLRCVNKKNSLTLMMVSCKEAKVHIPPGCEVILSPLDIHYPACCQVTFKCLKEVVKIIPIKYTPDNITKLTKNETYNFDSNNPNVDYENIENITISPSSIDTLSKESSILNKVKNNSTNIPIFIKRSKRENSLKTDESLGKCVTPDGNLGVGDTISVSGCAEIRCVSSNNTTNLVLVRCKITEKEIPQGCIFVPQEILNFPLCCMARFECININENVHPVSYTPENINKVGLSKEENLAERRKENATPLKILLRKERELKNSSYLSEDNHIDGCYTQNGMILREDETVTLDGCSQLRCVMIDGTLQMVTVGCSKDNVTSKEGCQIIRHSQSDQFPECCILEMDCEIPITYSEANLNHFDEMRPSNINNDIRKDNKYLEKREKRENPLQTSENGSKKCVTSKGLLKIGESVGLPNCSELKCISDNQVLTLIVVSCPVTQDQVKKGCTIIQNSSSQFPKCCEVTMVCVNVTKNEYPVVYTAANISDLPRNISENMISPLNDNINNNKNVSQAIRRKRETKEPTEVKGCNVKKEVLKPGQYISLKNCARLECLATKDDFYLAVASCPPNKVMVPTGCKIVPKSKDHYPECCEVVMVCEKVIKEVIPVVYAAANISNLDVNDEENLVSYSTIPLEDLKLKMDTSETQKSRRILKARFVSGNDSKTFNSSLVEDTSKSLPNNSSTNERTRKITRNPNSKLRITAPKNESKPSFFLPSKKRTSRNRRIGNSDKKVNETIELKNTMFITASPERKQSPSSKDDTTNRPSTRRLSSLLSSRSLRINTTPKPQAASESQNKPQYNRLKTGIKQKKLNDESIKDKKDIIETSDKNETLPEKDVKRRNIYASRLNKYIAKIEHNEKTKIPAIKNQTKDEQPKKKTSLKQKSKKEKKSKKVKKKKKKSKSKKSDKKKSTKKSKRKTDANSSLRRRLRPRPKTSVKVVKPEKKEEIPKKDNKSENKQEEESINLPVRSRSNFKKQEKISKKDNQPEIKEEEKSKNLSVRSRSNFNSQEKITKEDNKPKEKKQEKSKKLTVRSRLNVNKKEKSEKKEKIKKEVKNIKREKKPKETVTRVPRRRTQAKIKLKEVKKVESKPRAKETSRRRKSKPSFELKSTTDEKDESKLKDSGRGKVIFDASKLHTNTNKTKSTYQAIKKARPSIKEKGFISINETESTNKAIKTTRPSSRDRGSRRRAKKPKEKIEEIKKEEEKENEKEKESKEAKTIILEHTTETSKKEEKKVETKPEPISKTDIKITENEIGTIPPDFESIYNSGYSFVPSSLDDFDNFYKFPINDLELSSSDKEDSKSPNTKENEIIDIPDPPKVPIKITTVSFSTSRRSYKTSKTRNTSKNFKKTPTVYDKKETFQSAIFK